MKAPGPTIITLLTDFGTSDGYAAAMKGVILTLAPSAIVLDATHDIPPQDIRAGAWTLSTYGFWYPQGSIHVAVVDPGVGTERDALLVLADGRFFLTPDNGLLSMVLKQAVAVQLYRLLPSTHHPAGRSATFHGRDVFAYAAGLLARGEPVESMAEPCRSVVMPTWAVVRVEPERILGEVIHVDRFGNLITNIMRNHVAEKGWREITVSCEGGATMPLVTTYGCGSPGEIVALFGSNQALEIAVVGGSARAQTGWGRGAPVEVREKSSTSYA